MRIHFSTKPGGKAAAALAELTSIYGQIPLEEAEVVVTLGGDGSVLHTLHRVLPLGIPVYGLNQGTLGFLTNPYSTEHLLKRLATAHRVVVFSLAMTATTVTGEEHHAYAFNEVYLFRATHQTVKISVFINGTNRLETLVSDGIIVATPLGSTAYNFSAHGPIIPLDANVLAMTPINTFRPRNWRGALVTNTSVLEFVGTDMPKRALNAVADFIEIRDVERVTVKQDTQRSATLLFDAEASLADRILGEQFVS
ncbi:MAG: NAD kinase [Holosporales bacterium]|jgi:NAD+ kinase|nr:NAD kinase [Holosporales bacterium]